MKNMYTVGVLVHGDRSINLVLNENRLKYHLLRVRVRVRVRVERVSLS